MDSVEIFEVHITGDSSINKEANSLGIKNIIIDLLKPDKSYFRTEYMTSQIYRFSSFTECKAYVLDIVQKLKEKSVSIYRVKIESPYYPHYVDQSLYMESHFDAENSNHPMSKNVRKTSILGTDRVYDHTAYTDFKEQYKDKELELCLYDTNIEEDSDWFKLYDK